MNLKHSLTAAGLLGLIGILPASADSVPNPVAGDIFLAFRATDGQGADSSYLVDLGQDTVFRNAAAGSTLTLSTVGSIGADLTQIFGAGWATNGNLQWAVFGTRSSTSSSVYASRERSAASTVSVAWPALALDARNSTSSQISSVVDGIGGYRSRTATANSPVATLQPNSATASSYAYQVGTPGTSDFGSLSQWTSIEGSFSGGASSTVLDIYRISGSTTTPVQNLGALHISSTGTLTFTAATAAPSNVDSDGDGWSDADEATAGTNPNDPSDFFRVQALIKGSTGTTVRFNTAANRTYQIEYTDDLTSGAWTVVGTQVAGATGGSFDFSDTDATRLAKPRGFYRVRVSQ